MAELSSSHSVTINAHSLEGEQILLPNKMGRCSKRAADQLRPANGCKKRNIPALTIFDVFDVDTRKS